MLDGIIPEINDIGGPIEDQEQRTGFPSWATYCEVGNQVTDVLQYSRGISDFLGNGSILDPRKLSIVTFQTKYGDFGGGYHYIKSEKGDQHSELYNDAEYFLGLDYNGLIIAFIGFNINEDGNVEVTQIQGANIFGESFGKKVNHNGFLKNFKWKEYLVEELTNFLKYHNIGKKVTIISGENNGWLDDIKGYQMYDQVALDLGFRGTPDNGYTKVL